MWHRPPLSFMFHIWHDYKHTQKCTDTHPHITKNLATALSACQWLDSPRSLEGLRDTVTVSQDPCRQPWDEKPIITLFCPRWMAGGHTMMRWKEWKRGNRPEAYFGDGTISTSAPVTTKTGWEEHNYKNVHTHAHSQESNRDGQFCHQGLFSCHSDIERLGPYEHFCSPKRCLEAGVKETCQLLLMRGHNQMWKLSCTLTGSIVANALLAVILMPFFSG